MLRLKDWICVNISNNFLYLLKNELPLVYVVQEMHNVFPYLKELFNPLHHDFQSKHHSWMCRKMLAFRLFESLAIIELIHFYFGVFVSDNLCCNILNYLPSFFDQNRSLVDKFVTANSMFVFVNLDHSFEVMHIFFNFI